MTDTPRWLTQLRCELANAREIEDGDTLVRTDDLEAALAEVERLTREHDRVQTALAAIETKALAEEQDGYAIAYCALWDAHGLLHDALNPSETTDTTEEPTP